MFGNNFTSTITLALLLGVAGVILIPTLTQAQTWFDSNGEVQAWHWHTYYFESNERAIHEATAFRKAQRDHINSGAWPDCSLNLLRVGWAGPHPISQWEMCCNKSSFNVVHSWTIQNHGNLSVLLHPLTEYEVEDHGPRASWVGTPVPLDLEYPALYPILPKPRPCPVYPDYTDEIPDVLAGIVKEDVVIIPGTEDYRRGVNKGFHILKDSY